MYSSFSSRFGFNGKEWDWETGNYYYGARYYDPQVSVWLSVDPWASKYPYMSPYNFVENNPLGLVDPTGMGPEDPGGGISGFFRKFGNWLKGEGWYAPSKSTEEIVENGQWNLEPVDVVANKPQKKQPYGRHVPGDMDGDALPWPEAEEYGPDLERFPMRRGPSKAPSFKNLGEFISKALNLVRKWIGPVTNRNPPIPVNPNPPDTDIESENSIPEEPKIINPTKDTVILSTEYWGGVSSSHRSLFLDSNQVDSLKKTLKKNQKITYK